MASCHQPTSWLSRWYRVIATAIWYYYWWQWQRHAKAKTKTNWPAVTSQPLDFPQGDYSQLPFQTSPKAWSRSDIWGILANPAWLRFLKCHFQSSLVEEWIRKGTDWFSSTDDVTQFLHKFWMIILLGIRWEENWILNQELMIWNEKQMRGYLSQHSFLHCCLRL